MGRQEVIKEKYFKYIAKEDCIVTSRKGAVLYREDLASDATIIVATYEHFVFVKAHLLPDIIDCFPDQPEAWVKELGSCLALEQQKPLAEIILINNFFL